MLQWVMNDVNNRVVFRVVRDIRAQAFEHLQVLPLRYLDAHPAGELVSRVIADADTFADGLLMRSSRCDSSGVKDLSLRIIRSRFSATDRSGDGLWI